jgi:hypothetical protein
LFVFFLEHFGLYPWLLHGLIGFNPDQVFLRAATSYHLKISRPAIEAFDKRALAPSDFS